MDSLSLFLSVSGLLFSFGVIVERGIGDVITLRSISSRETNNPDSTKFNPRGMVKNCAKKCWCFGAPIAFLLFPFPRQQTPPPIQRNIVEFITQKDAFLKPFYPLFDAIILLFPFPPGTFLAFITKKNMHFKALLILFEVFHQGEGVSGKFYNPPPPPVRKYLIINKVKIFF